MTWSALILAALVLSGCPTREAVESPEPAKKSKPSLKLPKVRLEREAEQELLAILDKLRAPAQDADYLSRVKAEEDLGRLLEQAERSGLESLYVPYMLQLLDEPSWDTRAIILKLIMRYGRTTPAAVAALVQLIGDMSVNAPLRQRAAEVLEMWTRLGIGYNAWAEPEEVKSAAGKWKEWFDRTGGVISSR